MIISAPKENEISGVITIPSSKSISNRILIINALCNEEIDFQNISNSDDTSVLRNALRQIGKDKTKGQHIDIGMAGTSFRFLTAFLSIQKGEFVLTGSKRIQERPIKPLVDILLRLGADITYLENDGFAPLAINGKKLNGGKVSVVAGVSSQFITALMLIAPQLKDGLQIELKGEIASLPYLKMTQNLMQYFCIGLTFENKIFRIPQTSFQAKEITIESDWSSASYFYQCLAIAEKGSLKLSNYYRNSIQGDSKLIEIYESFGVRTNFIENDILLTKVHFDKNKTFKYDFINEPDLAQAVICTCVALGIKAELTGLESLRIKETDRILALKTEINKLNWDITQKGVQKYYLEQKDPSKLVDNIIFQTYDDHRMAMCLAPLSLKFGEIQIEKPEVVSKSNVSFWKLMEEIGFVLK